MIADYSKSLFIYTEIRRALQSGRFAPGQRIDPGSLAEEFHTSPTPVRFALYRLVGEGIVTDHARSGVFVPLPSEIALRDRYDWMMRLMLIACDIGIVRPTRNDDGMDPTSQEADVVKLTWQLFDAIARATDHRALHADVKRTNDRLAPIRRAKLHLIDDAADELGNLRRQWQARDIEALRHGLTEYHERRKRLVPRIVAMLVENYDRMH